VKKRNTRSVPGIMFLALALAGCGRPGANRAPAARAAPAVSSSPAPAAAPAGQPAPEIPAARVVSDPALEGKIRDFYDAVATGDTERIRELSTSNTFQDHLALPLKHINTARFKVQRWLPTSAEGRSLHLKTYAEIRMAAVEYDLLEDSPAERKGRVTAFVTIVRETPTSPWRIDEIGCGP